MHFASDLVGTITFLITVGGILFKIISYYNKFYETQIVKYSSMIETLYIDLVRIYIAEKSQKETKVKEFVNTINYVNINPNILPNYEYGVQNLRNSINSSFDFRIIESRFDDFAKSVEFYYWIQYKYKFYTKIQSSNQVSSFFRNISWGINSVTEKIYDFLLVIGAYLLYGGSAIGGACLLIFISADVEDYWPFLANLLLFLWDIVINAAIAYLSISLIVLLIIYIVKKHITSSMESVKYVV